MTGIIREDHKRLPRMVRAVSPAAYEGVREFFEERLEALKNYLVRTGSEESFRTLQGAARVYEQLLEWWGNVEKEEVSRK